MTPGPCTFLQDLQLALLESILPQGIPEGKTNKTAQKYRYNVIWVRADLPVEFVVF